MSRLAILGASGHGKVIADAALAAGWKSVSFYDDDWPGTSSVGDWPVLGATAGLIAARADFDGAVVAIGHNATRLRKLDELRAGRVALATIVHPSAVVSAYATLGEGTVVLAGAVVNPFARLGRGCIVNTCSSVDHDSDLADAVHVCPGAHTGGNVRVGEASWIGIGATVKNGVTIGAGVTVGAGAVVVADVIDGLTVLGVPAGPHRC